VAASTSGQAHTWQATRRAVPAEDHTQSRVRGKANIDSPVLPCELEETRTTAVERPERRGVGPFLQPKAGFFDDMAFAEQAVTYEHPLSKVKRGRPGHGAGALGCRRRSRSRLCRGQLGSAAPKHGWWARFTAIAGHHVAGAWVLDGRSHSSRSVACFAFARRRKSRRSKQ
jgi:hypothetical protein